MDCGIWSEKCVLCGTSQPLRPAGAGSDGSRCTGTCMLGDNWGDTWHVITGWGDTWLMAGGHVIPGSHVTRPCVTPDTLTLQAHHAVHTVEEYGLKEREPVVMHFQFLRIAQKMVPHYIRVLRTKLSRSPNSWNIGSLRKMQMKFDKLTTITVLLF